METKKKHILITSLVLLLTVLVSGFCFANSPENNKKQLRKNEQVISTLLQTLHKYKAGQQSLVAKKARTLAATMTHINQELPVVGTADNLRKLLQQVNQNQRRYYVDDRVMLNAGGYTGS